MFYPRIILKMKNKIKSKNAKLTTKEISILSECSLRTADRIKAEIKKTFKLKKVTLKAYEYYYLISQSS